MSPISRETRSLLCLASPVVSTQVATMLMGVVDTVMVGRLGTEALGAALIGAVWVWGTLCLAMGVLMGLDPLVSQAHGAGDGERAGLALQRGLVLAAALSPPLALLWARTGPVLEAFGQDPQLAAVAARYVRVQIPSIPAFLAYTALRQYLTARGIVAPAMWVAWAANFVNVLLNWVLIFGGLGFAARGVVGAGIATAAARIFLLVALVALTLRYRLHAGAWPGWRGEALALRGLGELLGLGAPVGLQMGLEVWCFHTASLIAGNIDAVALAAHSIVLNLASLSFMVPLGISIAAATRVGNLIGAGEPRGARRAALVALGLGAAVMSASALVFLTLRHHLPLLFGAEPAVAGLAARVFPIAAAFQIFDGTQAVGCGVLRGMGDTRPAALINLVGYWALALPVGAWLAFDRGLGLVGLWWGLTLGLLAVAFLLVLKIAWRGPESVRPLASRAV